MRPLAHVQVRFKHGARGSSPSCVSPMDWGCQHWVADAGMEGWLAFRTSTGSYSMTLRPCSRLLVPGWTPLSRAGGWLLRHVSLCFEVGALGACSLSLPVSVGLLARRTDHSVKVMQPTGWTSLP